MTLIRTNTLGRAAVLGAFALGALLVALTANVGRADDEEQQPPGKRGKGGDPRSIENELKQKLEEVERLKQRLEESRKSTKKGGTVRVEISGASGEEVERATAALRKAMPGKDVQVSGTKGHFNPESMKGPGKSWSAKGEGKFSPKMEREHPAPAAGGPIERRIDALEAKLDEVMRELKAQRTEPKREEPKGKGGFGGKGGGKGGPGGKGGFGPKQAE